MPSGRGGWIIDVGFDERHQAGRDGLAVRDRLDPLASVGNGAFPHLICPRAERVVAATFGRRPLNPAFVICPRAERVVGCATFGIRSATFEPGVRYLSARRTRGVRSVFEVAIGAACFAAPFLGHSGCHRASA